MDEFEKFYNKALKFLSYRPRSEKEIRDYLIRRSGKPKAHPESDSGQARMTVINRIINKLKEQKFLDDEEFAKWWIEQRIQFKPRSLKLIRLELKQKGIDRDLIDAQISNFPASQRGEQFPISNELDLAKRLVEKKIKKYKDLPRQEIYQKMGRFLSQKGFGWDVIKKSIDEALRKDV